MKVFELMSELSKLPAGLNVELRFPPSVENEIYACADDAEALQDLLQTAHVQEVCQLINVDQGYVELLCEVKC